MGRKSHSLNRIVISPLSQEQVTNSIHNCTMMPGTLQWKWSVPIVYSERPCTYLVWTDKLLQQHTSLSLKERPHQMTLHTIHPQWSEKKTTSNDIAYYTSPMVWKKDHIKRDSILYILNGLKLIDSTKLHCILYIIHPQVWKIRQFQVTLHTIHLYTHPQPSER